MSMHALTGEVPRFTVAERIVLARTIAGLDQREVAERVGISRTTLAGYENRNWPRTRKLPFLRAIARACGVDETWLIEGVELTPGPGAPTTDAKSDGQITACSSLAPVIKFTSPVKKSPARQPSREAAAA